MSLNLVKMLMWVSSSSVIPVNFVADIVPTAAKNCKYLINKVFIDFPGIFARHKAGYSYHLLAKFAVIWLNSPMPVSNESQPFIGEAQEFLEMLE
ncbi:MAG: hypothetical protein KJP16_10975, partial [Gammaproteobacteria bacterium]|nr:hypothetical protein [Gammaproteobacteria bacterium]NNL51332.1 hypothetical protein [Woeseiaceae bacterium]